MRAVGSDDLMALEGAGSLHCPKDAGGDSIQFFFN